MAYNETGHAMNVAAFGKATLAVSGLGERYNPSHPEISAQAMNTANDQILASMKEVRDVEAALNTLVKARRKAFDKLPLFITRIIGAVDASNIPAAKKVVLRTLGKKITGASNKKKKTVPADGATVNYSTSRMSFIMRIENLERMSSELEQMSGYAPSEKDLSPTSIQALAVNLKEKNKEIDTMADRLAKARNQRNILLYAVEKGAADLLKMVKSYIKSWPEGTKGIEYMRIKGIPFKRFK
jgi:hypothetical protein